MGESLGYDLQSLGFDELGLVSADIQLAIPCCPYSYALPFDALDGPWRQLAKRSHTGAKGSGAQQWLSKLTLGVRRITFASKRLHGWCHVLDGRDRQLRIRLVPVNVRWNPWLHSR
jgi:hypothetical protein